jgi:hypothetical protein
LPSRIRAACCYFSVCHAFFFFFTCAAYKHIFFFPLRPFVLRYVDRGARACSIHDWSELCYGCTIEPNDK